jgi:hypothetical protein
MKVLLFTNRENDATSQVVTSVCAWLADQGVGYELFSGDIFGEKSRFEELGLTAAQIAEEIGHVLERKDKAD